MRNLRGFGAMVTAVCAAVAAGCNGGSSGLSSASGPTYSSDSFSPKTAVSAAGEPAGEVWWRMRINGGAPVSVPVNGMPGTFTFEDMEVRIPSGGAQRTTTLDGTLTASTSAGSVTSRVHEESVDTLSAGPPPSVTRETMHQTQHLTGSGIVVDLDENVMTSLSIPLTDFSDRADLDQLPVGHVDEITLQFTTTATATATANGQPNTNVVTEVDMVHQRWTVVQQLPSMTVLGKSYARVVDLRAVADTTNTATGATTTQTSEYWMAAGIGIIRETLPSNGVAGIGGQAVELVDTNLRQK